jgi:L-asparagine oxygenase
MDTLIANASGSLNSRDVAARLESIGYLFESEWFPDRSTLEIAQMIGSPVDIGGLLPRSGIPTVQTIKPHCTTESRENQYSGTYGLAEFPLHTDLAHWARPPRYFLLRCKVGVPDVATHLLPTSAVSSALTPAVLRRAVLRPRRRSSHQKLCLLPLLFPVDRVIGFRWDSLFLVPMNDAANKVAEVISTNLWDSSLLISVILANPGDTLILDNWRFLHGRSSVATTDLIRTLERAYLSKLTS